MKKYIWLLAALAVVGCGGGGSSAGFSPEEALARTESFWVARHEDIVAEAARADHEILIVGDSTASMLGGVPSPDTAAIGEPALREAVGNRSILNAGIRGDRIQNVLWRIRNGACKEQQPKLILIMVGSNNLGQESAKSLANRLSRLTKELRESHTSAKILVLGLPPVDEVGTTARWRQDELNRALKSALPLHYIEIAPLFLDQDGARDPSLIGQSAHPTAAGYRKLIGELKPLLLNALK